MRLMSLAMRSAGWCTGCCCFSNPAHVAHSLFIMYSPASNGLKAPKASRVTSSCGEKALLKWSSPSPAYATGFTIRSASNVLHKAALSRARAGSGIFK